MKRLAVTGHRPKTLNLIMDYDNSNDEKYKKYIDNMNEYIKDQINQGFGYFYSGGAMGVDLDFADCILKLRAKGYDIKLEIAIPCENQDLRWDIKHKEKYKSILEQADKITYVAYKYTKYCMQKRNEYMVNSCDKVVAFYVPETKGGTLNTINYAKRRGKEIDIIKLIDL